jgi:hypothetical protein
MPKWGPSELVADTFKTGERIKQRDPSLHFTAITQLAWLPLVITSQKQRQNVLGLPYTGLDEDQMPVSSRWREVSCASSRLLGR